MPSFLGSFRAVCLIFFCCFSSTALALSDEANSDQMKSTSATNSHFTPGQMSISVGLPNGKNPFEDNAFGLWYAASDSMLLGLQINLAINSFLNGIEERDWSWDVAFVPGLRYYFRLTDTISPFFYSHLRLALGDPTTRFVGSKDPDLSLRLAFGGEWFVQSSIGIAAYMGVDLGILRQSPLRFPSLGTFASGILANIYF